MEPVVERTREGMHEIEETDLTGEGQKERKSGKCKLFLLLFREGSVFYGALPPSISRREGKEWFHYSQRREEEG